MSLNKKQIAKQQKIEEMKLRNCVELPKAYKHSFDEKPVIYCKEDNKNSYMTIDSFSRHYLKKHFNMTLKEYYDKWYKKENEGKCVVCNKPTKFISGCYTRTCSAKCARKDPQAINKIKESCKNRNYKVVNEKIKNTMMQRYGVEHAKQAEQFNKKSKKTNLERYGSTKTFADKDHRAKAAIVLERDKDIINAKRRNSWTSEKILLAKNLREQTLQETYGENIINISQVPEIQNKIKNTMELEGRDKIRKTNELSGRWESVELRAEMKNYRFAVWKETRKHIKKLISTYNGYDYYTNEPLITNEEYLKNNPGKHVCTNKYQPTIEHKNSVKYGFDNKISPSLIGDIKNLVIISRRTNSRKGSMIESEFRKVLNEKQY